MTTAEDHDAAAKVWRAELAPFWRVFAMTPAQAKHHPSALIFPTELAAVWCLIVNLEAIRRDADSKMCELQKRKAALQAEKGSLT